MAGTSGHDEGVGSGGCEGVDDEGDDASTGIDFDKQTKNHPAPTLFHLGQRWFTVPLGGARLRRVSRQPSPYPHSPVCNSPVFHWRVPGNTRVGRKAAVLTAGGFRKGLEIALSANYSVAALI